LLRFYHVKPNSILFRLQSIFQKTKSNQMNIQLMIIDLTDRPKLFKTNLTETIFKNPIFTIVVKSLK